MYDIGGGFFFFIIFFLSFSDIETTSRGSDKVLVYNLVTNYREHAHHALTFHYYQPQIK